MSATDESLDEIKEQASSELRDVQIERSRKVQALLNEFDISSFPCRIKVNSDIQMGVCIPFEHYDQFNELLSELLVTKTLKGE